MAVLLVRSAGVAACGGLYTRAASRGPMALVGARWTRIGALAALPLAAGLVSLRTVSTAPAPAPAGPTWTARWISVAGAPAFDYGVYHFRRRFTLAERPARFVVHVSADNRYQLFANGTRVSLGPARGDLDNWRYVTVELAPHLVAGDNVL